MGCGLTQPFHCCQLVLGRKVRYLTAICNVLCPINCCTVRISTPAITSRLANVWRRQCQVKS